MKILGSLLRLLCALVVLLAVAVYLDGSLQVSLVDYLAAFTPEHIQSLADLEGWPVITAGALLLLTLCCGITLGWNIVYSLATIAFFAEAALLTLGPELALPTATRGLGWEPLLRELSLNYPVPTLMVPALCILGCLCSNAPVRIAWTSLLGCALSYGCAELLHYGLGAWQAMPEPFLPHALELVKSFPWMLAALPALFFLQYCLIMAVFEVLLPRKKKKDREEKKEQAAEAEKPAESTEAAPTAALPSIPTPVVVKRPVVKEKAAATPAPAEEKPEAPQPEEETPQTPAETEAPKSESAEEAPAEAEAKAEEAPAEPAAEEKAAEEPGEAEPAAEEAPAASIPSVPLPPAPNAGS